MRCQTRVSGAGAIGGAARQRRQALVRPESGVRMDCIAHRGFAGAAPENTIDAVRRAAAVADWIEVDVRRCGSGELVACHDETVDRVTDGTGPVAAHSADELADLDVLGSGAGVPTLRAAFEAVPDDVGLNVEVKEAGLAADLDKVVSTQRNDVLVSAFDPEALAAVAEACAVPVAVLFASDPAAGLETARELDAAAVHPHWDLCDEAFVDRVHDAGVAVNAWTVADERAARAVRAAGVDGVITDHPRFCPDC